MPDRQSSPEAKEYQDILAEFRNVGLAALVVLVGGAIFYHYAMPLPWLDAFYFCIITLTTVGYGDITPHSDVTKIFTMCYVLVGVGIIATFANLLLKRASIRREMHRNEKLRPKG
jgi:voltage-gated potassium channel